MKELEKMKSKPVLSTFSISWNLSKIDKVATKTYPNGKSSSSKDLMKQLV